MRSEIGAFMQEKRAPDYALMLAIAILLGIGLVMVYSSSVVKAQDQFRDGFFYLKRQGLWILVGIPVMLAAMYLPYPVLQRWAKPFFIVSLVLLAVVLIPGVGMTVKGARRWIGYGGLQFQPSELMKIALVVFMGDLLTRREKRLGRFLKGFLPPVTIIGLVFGLIMLEPDMGTALATGGTAVVMLFAAGASVWHLGGLVLAGVPALIALIIFEPYRMARLTSFLDPFKDPQDTGYHIIQALYALGSGGLFGLGLGRSRQKFWYLPEQHTDFIFSILAEELGFIGAGTVILLFFFVAWRGYRIAVQAPDRFSSLLAVGVTTLIILQACINIGVNTSSMPITGITLPFISYGGSSLLFTMAGAGILLGISRHAAGPGR